MLLASARRLREGNNTEIQSSFLDCEVRAQYGARSSEYPYPQKAGISGVGHLGV
jgi:hypothetical protein